MIGKRVVEILDMTELKGDGEVILDNVVEQQQNLYITRGKQYEAILVTDEQWAKVKDVTFKKFAEQDLDPPPEVMKDTLFGSPVWRQR